VRLDPEVHETKEDVMSTSRVRTWLVTAAVMAGATVGAAGIANAASGGSTSSGFDAQAQAANPATMTHGPGETLLTGSTAASVKQAALAAVPGATVIRVETDSSGAAYEAHLTKADGTQVTVKLNSAFKVTGTESGFGAPPSH
jgi:uncharacterized membrane protein YkoI